MKKISFFLLLFSFTFVLSQEFKQVGDNISFSEIVELHGKSKSEIYKGIKLFLNDTNEKSKYFIDLDDIENDVISFSIETPNYGLSYLYWFKTQYKATIDIKDGKFRYTIGKIDFIRIIPKLTLELKTNYNDIVKEAESSEELERLHQELSSAKRERRKLELSDTIEKRKKNIAEVKKNIEKTKQIISSQPNLIKEYILKNENW